MEVFIANNNEIARFGLMKIVESIDSGSRTICAHSRELLQENINWCHFDFIILNRLKRKDNVSDFLRKLRLPEKKTKVLVLSDQTGFAEMQFLFSLGIKGYVDSSASLEVIRKATEAVLGGMLYVEPAMLVKYAGICSASQYAGVPALGAKLSDKEAEIANFLVAGLRTAEISNILNKNASTVSAHKRKIFDKLRIENVVELVRYMETNPEIDLVF